MMADDAPKLATLTEYVVPAFTMRSLLFAKLKLAASTPMDHPSSPQKSAWCFRNKSDVHHQSEESAGKFSKASHLYTSNGAITRSQTRLSEQLLWPADGPRRPPECAIGGTTTKTASRADGTSIIQRRKSSKRPLLPLAIWFRSSGAAGQEEIVKMDTLGKNQFMHQFYQS